MHELSVSMRNEAQILGKSKEIIEAKIAEYKKEKRILLESFLKEYGLTGMLYYKGVKTVRVRLFVQETDNDVTILRNIEGVSINYIASSETELEMMLNDILRSYVPCEET